MSFLRQEHHSMLMVLETTIALKSPNLSEQVNFNVDAVNTLFPLSQKCLWEGIP